MLCSTYSSALLTKGTQWFVSEKYDGWRMFYKNGSFYSRTGKPIKAPTHIRNALDALNLPSDVCLDGELWFGYNGFQEIVSAIDMEHENLQWLLFDMPSAEGGYADRLKMLKTLVQTETTYPISVIEQFQVQSEKELDLLYETICKKNEKVEGIVIRPANMPYEWETRTLNFMKRKPFQDAEAQVLCHLVTEKGKMNNVEGYVSSLECQLMESGKTFRLSLRTNKGVPMVGAIVTVQYQNLTKDGVPRFASLKGVRSEMDMPEQKAKPIVKSWMPVITVLPKNARVVTMKEIKDEKMTLRVREKIYIEAGGKMGGYHCVTQPKMGLPYCSCAAWRFQRLPPAKRICKHGQCFLSCTAVPEVTC
jgi:DNA ligase-1